MKILLVLMFIVSPLVNAQCYKQLAPWDAMSVCAPTVTPGSCPVAQITQAVTGALIPTTDTLDTCTGHWISSASDIRNAQAVEVTPEGFLQAFTFGITLYLTFWYGPFLVSLAKQIIRRL